VVDLVLRGVREIAREGVKQLQRGEPYSESESRVIGAPLENAFAEQTVLLEIAEGQFAVKLTVDAQVVVREEFDAQAVPRATAYRVWGELLT
jgi:hypothetical protein